MQVTTYLLLSFLIILLSSCESPTSSSAPPHPLAVRTTEVRVGPIKETLRYLGTVHSRNEIKVLARASGKVARLPIAEGEAAARGKKLALIAAPELDARVTRMQADVVRVKEESAFLCQQANIDRELLSSNSISKVRADASRQKCDSSRAGLRAAQAGLREVVVMAGRSIERAPFDGKVLKWLSEPGENIQPGSPILLFGDAPLEVRVLVHEKDITSGITKGGLVILLPQHPQPIRAEVTFVSPLASGPGRMMEVRIPLTQAQGDRFQHGMSMDVAFVLREKNDALAVPERAVFDSGTEMGLYRIENDNADWVKVSTSMRENGWIAIDGDVKPGDRVVVGNLELVKDGMTVYSVEMKEDTP